jgi:type I restriction enzyme R subunit
MFVDKKLNDLKAVQTLSRLNRTCAGKEDTFILDFENKAEDIREAFKPYYEQPEIDEPTDPNQLYLLKAQLEAFQFYWGQEVFDFAKVFYKPVAKQAPSDQAKLHGIIDFAVQRFTDDPAEERQEEFRHLVDTYTRLYGFVSQIMPFEDTDLERLYSYLRLMRTKLPRRESSGILDLEDDVNLAFYRLTRTFEGSVSLGAGDTGVLTGAGEVGTSKPKDDALSPLSAIITLINDKFGTDFDENDKLFWDQVNTDLSKDDSLTEQARTNDLDNFRHAFDPKAVNAVLNRSERNTHTFEQFMADDDMRRMLLSALAAEFHANARRAEG